MIESYPSTAPSPRTRPAIPSLLFQRGRALLLPLLLLTGTAQATQAIGKADGFAVGTTGGGNLASVHPTTPGELQAALCDRFSGSTCVDTTPRVIVLDRSFDFTGSIRIDGASRTTTVGCLASHCPSGKVGQLGRNITGYCAGRTPTQISYDNAGIEPLQVGSNKTVLGVGRAAAIKGRGLRVGDGNGNVIIQNIAITDINPELVWGGDALTLDNAHQVWIDHDYFARIGRQMIVTGHGSAANVTLSNNEFDGRTEFSTSCDGHHYWLWLFLGQHDTITVARNFIHDTSGRGPHAGGVGNASVRAQIVNNYFKNLSDEGAAMPLTNLASLLLEGNAFDHVSLPVYRYPNSPGPGYAFAPFVGMADPRNDLCSKYLGRTCVGNGLVASGSAYQPLDEAAIADFASLRSGLVSPQPAAGVAASVPRRAGIGVIN